MWKKWSCCTDENCTDEKKCKCSCCSSKGGCCAVYGLGIVGAAVYYISVATTFWIGVLGFLKAIVWPAFLVYEALKAFGV